MFFKSTLLGPKPKFLGDTFPEIGVNTNGIIWTTKLLKLSQNVPNLKKICELLKLLYPGYIIAYVHKVLNNPTKRVVGGDQGRCSFHGLEAGSYRDGHQNSSHFLEIRQKQAKLIVILWKSVIYIILCIGKYFLGLVDSMLLLRKWGWLFAFSKRILLLHQAYRKNKNMSNLKFKSLTLKLFRFQYRCVTPKLLHVIGLTL